MRWRIKSHHEWHKWFAWKPIKVNGYYVWLETVLRRRPREVIGGVTVYRISRWEYCGCWK